MTTDEDNDDARDPIPAELVIAGCTPELLAHVVYAMHLSGSLKDVSREHIDSIAYSLQASGHQDIVLTTNFSYVRPDLLTTHNCDFMREPAFVAAYAAGLETGSWGGIDVEWRVNVLCWAALQALKVEGDFVECGVNRGGFSKSVMTYLDWQNVDRKFYLLDTFCGIPENLKDKAAQNNWTYEECFESVTETFAQYSNVQLIRGIIPDTLPQVPSKKIAYLSIDLNCAEPEIDAANYFWNKLSPGSLIVLDDYGAVPGYQRQKDAWDQFALEHSTSILSLPTGQGLIIRHADGS